MRLVMHFWKQILKYFLAGLLALLPVAVTVAIVLWVASFLQSYVGPETLVGSYLSEIGFRFSPNSNMKYVVGWLFVLSVIFVIGLFVELGAKKAIASAVDRMFARIPLIGSIYSTSKQVVGMFESDQDAALKGMSAVVCHFGDRSGVAVLAFLVSPEVYRVGEQDYNIVIIPMAPVPFGGAMLFVPVDQIQPAGYSVDGMMSIYLSMGVTASQYMKTTETSAQPEVE